MCERIVYDYLNQLLNQKVCAIGRACNMLWLGIGKELIVLNKNGEEVKKSTFAIHVQSAWRIVNRERNEIVVASSDIYVPNSKIVKQDFHSNWHATGIRILDSKHNEKEFDWDVQGNSLFDEKAQQWLDTSNPINVKEYKITRWGDLLLTFSNDDRLEIYVDCSDEAECWRFFQCESNNKHLVVTGTGISF